MKKVWFKSGAMLFVAMLMTSMAYSQTSSDYKTKIENLNKEMARNMLAGNNEKNLSLYTKDAISMPAGEPMEQGLDAIKKASEDMKMKGVKYNSFVPVTLKVLVNGNEITEVGTYKVSLTMTGMDKPIDDHGKYLTVWEKQPDGSLKIKIETWNSDQPPMSSMSSGQ